MKTTMHSLLSSELSNSIAALFTHATELHFQEQLPQHCPEMNSPGARELIQLLGETGLVSALVEPDSHQSRLLHQVHLANWLAGFAASAATDLVLHQLCSIYPILKQLSSTSPEARALTTQLLHAEKLTARVIQPWGPAAKADALQTGNNWIIQGELPLCLLGLDTEYLLIALTKRDSQDLNIFALPTDIAGLKILARAPVSTRSNYFIARISLTEVQLAQSQHLGSVDVGFIQQGRNTQLALAAIANNYTSETTLITSIDFLRKRVANNVPLLKLDVLQQRLAALRAELSMAKALAWSTLDAQATDNFTQLAHASYENSRQLLQTISTECLHLGGINHYRSDSELANAYQEARWNTLFSEYTPTAVLADYQE